jgi:hypothetical protein
MGIWYHWKCGESESPESGERPVVRRACSGTVPANGCLPSCCLDDWNARRVTIHYWVRNIVASVRRTGDQPSAEVYAAPSMSLKSATKAVSNRAVFLQNQQLWRLFP